MIRSERRILTTHVGSLPRPPALRDLLVRQDRGEPVDARDLAGHVEAAVRWAVERQLAAGIDIVNDGEQPRVGFSTTSATADLMRAASALASTGTPSSRANISRMRSSGRGRLPVCVVRKRSVLRRMSAGRAYTIAPRTVYSRRGDRE